MHSSARPYFTQDNRVHPWSDISIFVSCFFGRTFSYSWRNANWIYNISLKYNASFKIAWCLEAGWRRQVLLWSNMLTYALMTPHHILNYLSRYAASKLPQRPKPARMKALLSPCLEVAWAIILTLCEQDVGLPSTSLDLQDADTHFHINKTYAMFVYATSGIIPLWVVEPSRIPYVSF